jgi:hypothetical protein
MHPWTPAGLLRQLLTGVIELAGLDCFDVMAHIGYPRRYMRRDGFDTKLTLAEHGDALSALSAL